MSKELERKRRKKMSNKVIVNGVDMIKLIERDTPVKIYYHTIKAFRKDDCDSVVALCPVCSMDVFNIFEIFNYCPRCGQKLDWEEE